MPLPTLDDFKTHLNMTGTGDDAELYDVLYAAVDVVEGIVGPLRGREITETHYGTSADVLVLRHAPATSLSMVTFQGQSPSAIGDFLLDSESGILRFVGGYRFYGNVTVTYTPGYVTVPAAVRLATLMIGKQMWDTQRGSQPLPLQGAAEETPADFGGYDPGIPARARILLESFARGPRIA